MMKNRTAQLIFQSAFCAIGLIGIAASLGLFDMVWRWDFYIHFTNLSNYFCICIMFAELIQTARKKDDSFVTTAPVLKFIGVLAIVLTFLVFNLLLAGEPSRDPALNYKVSSITFHVILPILFTLDWILFYEHGKLSWKNPLQSMSFPIVYLVFIFLHAWAHHFDAGIPNYTQTGPFIYPYFFVNPVTQGTAGVAKWCVLLAVGFVLFGYLLYGMDCLLKRVSRKPVAHE